MLTIYPTTYRDALGEEQTAIENDDQTLRMVVRGVEFVGGSFSGFAPAAQGEASQAGFTLDSYGDLIAATLVFDVPMSVVAGRDTFPGILRVHIDLEGAGPRAEADQDWADPCMTLSVGDKLYASSGGWGCFELELLQIQKLLPSDVYLKCCFNCAFSGYNPYGDGLWGMYCHRNHKEEYIQANKKSDWIRLNSLSAARVQETFLCPEFERWDGKSGYRDGLYVNRLNIAKDRADSPAASGGTKT